MSVGRVAGVQPRHFDIWEGTTGPGLSAVALQAQADDITRATRLVSRYCPDMPHVLVMLGLTEDDRPRPPKTSTGRNKR